MKDFGAHLKNARQTAGMTLDDIHEATRISLKNLRLIESGDFPSIPQTYVRAFVREYARAVGLDESETLTFYNEAAETEKGIPRPPETIDSSNLRIEVDDTIEYIEPLDRPTSPVEVEGTAEVAPDDYVQPVRKSRYVDEDSGTPIDIRTTAAASEALSPPARKSGGDAKTDDAKDTSELFEEGPHRKDVSAETEEKASAEDRSPEAPLPDAEAPLPDAEAKETTAKRRKARTAAVGADATGAPARKKDDAGHPEKESTDETKQRAARSAGSATTGASARPENGDEADRKKKSPPVRSPETPNEKRIIGIGLVIIAIIVIAVYGIFYFGADDESETAQVDSTAIKASIEAGRFIDSSQYAMTEMNLAAEDTLPAKPLPPPDPVESKPRVFERADSLVLEAFTSAPVWFSVKMDTLRTERGSLNSKEHRVWKAKDYFVITLGDAGAVTFFLNGREIGTLGEEGAVVKNVTLSRRQLDGN
jgi:hypothetical protein